MVCWEWITEHGIERLPAQSCCVWLPGAIIGPQLPSGSSSRNRLRFTGDIGYRSQSTELNVCLIGTAAFGFPALLRGGDVTATLGWLITYNLKFTSDIFYRSQSTDLNVCLIRIAVFGLNMHETLEF